MCWCTFINAACNKYYIIINVSKMNIKFLNTNLSDMVRELLSLIPMLISSGLHVTSFDAITSSLFYRLGTRLQCRNDKHRSQYI